MGRRLLLDTGVLIKWERGKLPASAIAADDDICLSIVVVAGYMTGVELAPPGYRASMERFLDAMLEAVPILPYDEEILPTHAKLLAWTQQHGNPRGQHDLIIAATAAVTGRTILTTDLKARFDELPGVTSELVG